MNLYSHIETFLKQAKNPLIVILGPTASGKTNLSLTIARKFDGEIISADSRQVYKYMDVATDKLLKEDQEGIAHHMIDIIEPSRQFTLADYKIKAFKTIKDIHSRKKVPILVGGTGLYISAVCENYQIPGVPPDYKLRQELTREFEEKGGEYLLEKLKKLDPQAAKKIDPRNGRYLIRALEINLSGKKNKTDQKTEPLFEILKIGIDWPREMLYDRINRRVETQIKRGLIEEVKQLLEKYNRKLPSMSSLGYPQIIKYLDDELTLKEAKELLQKETRNYAKRQITWWRRDEDIVWVEGEKL